MNHFPQCDICGAPHKAKDCGLNRLEAQRDPFGEYMRRQGYRDRERERQRKQNEMSTTSAQSSRGFGL